MNIHKNPLVSIIISSYNYARFVRGAIDSAINQTYSNIEIIAVDDGSKDNSAEIIKSYGNKITPVLKKNGGQASAFNAGFKRSKGQVIVFLDSDDALIPTAIENIISFFDNPEVVKAHWPLTAIDVDGNNLGRILPEADLSEGDLLQLVVDNGPESYVSSPTTGNAWSKDFLEKVLPIPEEDYVTCPDAYLTLLAPTYGVIKRITQPQGCYRIHGENNVDKISYSQQIQMFNHECRVLQNRLQEMGRTTDPASWMARPKTAWLQRVSNAIGKIATVISPQQKFILADENQWGPGKAGHFKHCIPFTEYNGQYWGLPVDGSSAIIEIESQRQNGATFIVFAWSVFWLLDYYSELRSYIQSNYGCIMKNEDVIIFNLNLQQLN